MTPHRRLALGVGAALPLAAVAVLAAAPAGAAPGPHAGRTLTTTLVGAEEVPRAGDPDGSGTGTLTLNPGQRTLCWTLEVAGIAPATAAHLHEQELGSAGPVVVALTAPSGGRSTGCTEVARELLRDLLTDPAGYYLNVHNAEYPAGALRGQLGD